MELLYILCVPLLAALGSLMPGRRILAPAITLVSSMSVLILSLETAFRTISAKEVIAVPDFISCDSFGALILLLVAIVGFAAAIFSWGYIDKISKIRQGIIIRPYYALFNLFLVSMLAVPLFSQVALVWIAVELTTLLSVFLVSFASTPEALEAAWKYVVLTCMGAAIALLGVLMLYWGMSAVSHQPFTWAGLAMASSKISPPVLNTAFFFILIGFGAKVGLVPLHTWLPDAHSQAPSPICALLSGVETTAVLYTIMRLFPLFQGTSAAHTGMWLMIFGLISAGVGAFLLIQAKEYKRLFAFSTVEHMGIILVAVGVGSYSAHFGAMLQIVGHSLAKALCFFAAGITLLTTDNREIGSVRGLIRTSPICGFFLMVGALGIAGAPPFAIFLSELSILKAGLASGQYWVTGLLAIFIVIAFVGILFQINHMVFGKPAVTSKTTLPATCVAALVIVALPVILLGVYIPGPVYDLLHLAAYSLGR
jgi:hydrogenase-4 component F